MPEDTTPKEPTLEEAAHDAATTPEPAVLGSAPEKSAETVSKAPKKNKLIILGAIVVGSLGILIGGSAAAYNLVYQNPDKVVLDAVSSLMQQKTSTHKMSIDIKADDATMKIAIDGKIGEAPSAEADIVADVTFDKQDFKVKASLLTDTDGVVYVKINDVKDLATKILGSSVDLSAFDKVIAKIDGKWLKISSDDVSTLSEEYAKTQECTTKALKSLKEKAVLKEVTDAYEKNRFIVVGDKLGVKDVSGVASLGYKVTVDSAKSDSFYTALGETSVGKALTKCDSSVDFKPETNPTKEDKDTTTEIQIWASRFGHQLTEIDATAKSKDVAMTIVWNPTFVDGVKVTTPASPIPVSEVMTDIQDAYMSFYMSSYSPEYSNSYGYDDEY